MNNKLIEDSLESYKEKQEHIKSNLYVRLEDILGNDYSEYLKFNSKTNRLYFNIFNGKKIEIGYSPNLELNDFGIIDDNLYIFVDNKRVEKLTQLADLGATIKYEISNHRK